MFGTTTATPQQNSGFSFGAATPAAPATSSGFSFGAAPATGAGATTTGTSGFNFGAPSTPAPSTGTGFNFGSTPAPATGSSFSFGSGANTTSQPAASTTPGFSFGGASPGATTASSAANTKFSFGGASPGTTTTAAPNTGFSFGGASSPVGATATPATSSGFNFGGASPGTTGTASSFNFGGTNATAKPPLFGQKTGTTGSTGFGGFGSSTGSSFGGFGSNTAAKPAGTTGFGFGTGTGTTGFGTTSGTSGFGGFSSTTPSAFGTSGGSTFGTAPVPVTTPAPIICGADPSVSALNSIKYTYQDPSQSRFKFLMYNTVDPTQRHLYTRPPYISERLWNQAELDNPDPMHCVPVPILGFKDLLKRIQVQQTYAEKYNKYTDDLRAQLKEMEKQTRATEEKLEKCRHEHIQLYHSLVKIMKDIEFLQSLGKPLQRDEMNLAMALKKLQTLLDSPGQYKARFNDIVSLERIQETSSPVPANNQLSPEDLQRIYQFLDKQRQGLEHLTNVLNDDLADIKLMKETWRR